MADRTDPLMRQFLEWVAARPRTYGQVMDTWRSSCPRLTVYEDALAGKLIEMDRGGRSPEGPELKVTSRGRAFMDAGRHG